MTFIQVAADGWRKAGGAVVETGHAYTGLHVFNAEIVFQCHKNFYDLYVTRSSAVAERPRDASCLSVVSFNIQRSFFITSYCGFRFTSA